MHPQTPHQERLAQGAFGTVYRAAAVREPGRPLVAVKLELCAAEPAAARGAGPGAAAGAAAGGAAPPPQPPPAEQRARDIKERLKRARLAREWEVYSRLGAVAAPGAGAAPAAARAGIPAVHAWGERCRL